MIVLALDTTIPSFLALGFALGALFVAIWARNDSKRLRTKIDESKADARRAADSSVEELEGKLAVLRTQVAQLASGAKIDPDQVREARLWRDASPAEALKLVTTGAVRLLDVRLPQETALGIIPGAQILAVQEIETRWREIPRVGKPLLVYCAGGARSAAACEFLSQQGFEELLNLDGGFQSWGGPRVKPG